MKVSGQFGRCSATQKGVLRTRLEESHGHRLHDAKMRPKSTRSPLGSKIMYASAIRRRDIFYAREKGQLSLRLFDQILNFPIHRRQLSHIWDQ